MSEHTDETRPPETTSPDAGYPSGTTEPEDGLRGDEGRVNADAAPNIADDAEKRQTATPAPRDDASGDDESARPRRP
jgi:hypothetical protein